MIRFKYFINFEKEEKWLVEMAEQGYQLKSAYFGYSFVPAPPEKATIRIDYRLFTNPKSFADYCSMFEDSGWQHITGSKQSGPQYFKKISNAAGDDIFSDSFSRAGRYKRLANMWLFIAVVWILLLAGQMTGDSSWAAQWMKIGSFLDFRSWYLTPGLWDMSGSDFWRAFLFETPFAFGRGLALPIWFVIVIVTVFFTAKSWRLYKSSL